MVSEEKLIKQGIKYNEALFKELERRLAQGILTSDTLEDFLARTEEYTTANPLVTTGYRDTMIRLILQETNNHKFSRPAQKELARVTIEQYIGDLIVGVGEDIKNDVRDIVKQGYNEGLSQKEIAENISNKIESIGKTRANVIARTEIARTATVSDYIIAKERGATNYVVECRSTRCDLCKELYCKTSPIGGDVEFTIDDVDHLPPYHPNCRCYAIFSKDGSKKTDNVEPIQSESEQETKPKNNQNHLWEDLGKKYGLEVVEANEARLKYYDPKHNTHIEFHIPKNNEWIDYTNRGQKEVNIGRILKAYDDMPRIHKQAAPTINIVGDGGGMEGEFVLSSKGSKINIYRSAWVERELYKGSGNLDVTMRHECSHAIDAKFIYDPTLARMSNNFWFSGNHEELDNGKYKKAISKDRRNRKKTGGQNYVSEYARQTGKTHEDFAEGLALRSFRDAPPEVRKNAYLWEKRGGEFVKVTYEDFERMYPNRCEVLDEVLDNYVLGWD